jgi:hypothetical protein
LKFALQRLKLAGQESAFSRARRMESAGAAAAVSLGRRKGAGVYALLGGRHDLDDAGDAALAASHAPRTRQHSNVASREQESEAPVRMRASVNADGSDADPALLSEERASELEKQSLRRRRFSDRNPRRMADVRFEQLDRTIGSTRFVDLAAMEKIEVPQFNFNKALVASQARKNMNEAGDFGNYAVKLSIFKSNVRGAENDVKAAVSDYKDAVSDVRDAQKQAMRMLNTLGPRVDRWHQASVSIVKLQKSLAAAHALDQKALQRFVHAAEGTPQPAAVCGLTLTHSLFQVLLSCKRQS